MMRWAHVPQNVPAPRRDKCLCSRRGAGESSTPPERRVGLGLCARAATCALRRRSTGATDTALRATGQCDTCATRALIVVLTAICALACGCARDVWRMSGAAMAAIRRRGAASRLAQATEATATSWRAIRRLLASMRLRAYSLGRRRGVKTRAVGATVGVCGAPSRVVDDACVQSAQEEHDAHHHAHRRHHCRHDRHPLPHHPVAPFAVEHLLAGATQCAQLVQLGAERVRVRHTAQCLGACGRASTRSAAVITITITIIAVYR